MMFNQCEFVLSVAALDQLPTADRPEIAFAGRSNVGKSSLLNALTKRKSLAKTSATPGRTQQLNYFNLSNKMYLVDMPGYGYAKVSKSLVKAWTKLMKDYLRGRATLRCVFLLIDSRHGLKASDIEMMELMDEAAVSYRIILTKADKVHENKRGELEEKIVQQIKTHGAAYPEILFTSSEKGEGIETLRKIAQSYAS